MKAFTFMEAIIALTIVSISLLALIKLHISSIRLVDAADVAVQAVFLADEKISETLATGFPEVGTHSGTVEKDTLRFQWQTQVTDLHSTQLEQVNIKAMRELTVDVSWKQGFNRKHLQMQTCVADAKLK